MAGDSALHPEVEVPAQAGVLPRRLLIFRLLLNRATDFLKNLLDGSIRGLYCFHQRARIGAVTAIAIRRYPSGRSGIRDDGASGRVHGYKSLGY